MTDMTPVEIIDEMVALAFRGLAVRHLDDEDAARLCELVLELARRSNEEAEA